MADSRSEGNARDGHVVQEGKEDKIYWDHLKGFKNQCEEGPTGQKMEN